MIVLHSVSKDVGKGALKRRVLSGIDWEIPPRSHVVVLGHTGSGKSLLLSLIAGLSTPTHGWVERIAVVSLPGGVLRFGNHETLRGLIHRMSEVYRADPQQIVDFVVLFPPIREILDVHINRLRGVIRAQLNAALNFAFPCDYYLFDGNTAPGRDLAFRQFCHEAFAVRRAQAATIVTANSVKIARELDYNATGAVLFQGKLHFYKTLPEAIAVFEKLPADVASPKYRDPGSSQKDEEEYELL